VFAVRRCIIQRPALLRLLLSYDAAVKQSDPNSGLIPRFLTRAIMNMAKDAMRSDVKSDIGLARVLEFCIDDEQLRRGTSVHSLLFAIPKSLFAEDMLSCDECALFIRRNSIFGSWPVAQDADGLPSCYAAVELMCLLWNRDSDTHQRLFVSPQLDETANSLVDQREANMFGMFIPGCLFLSIILMCF
jgi:hypothetical protein